MHDEKMDYEVPILYNLQAGLDWAKGGGIDCVATGSSATRCCKDGSSPSASPCGEGGDAGCDCEPGTVAGDDCTGGGNTGL